MSPSHLHLNLLAERAKDCTVSCAVTAPESRSREALPVVDRTWFTAPETA